ncbi:MAG TPA: flagellar hook-associated protein FlgL [Gemmatimonadales bacterium]|nr:flagellar hook-associated protein FlgL [Gemmatimonadales bacterium]
MRVTDNMRQAQVLRHLQGNLAELARAQSQVATGKRFTRPSEDPVAASRVMRAEQALRGLTQYRRNTTAVRARVDAEEAVLDQVTDLMTRAKELATEQATDSATPATRAIAAAELDRVIEQVIQLGNTRVGSEHLFGGHQTAAPPFQPDGTYLGDDGARQAELSDGYVITTNHTGRELLVQSGALGGLTALRDALRAGTRDGVAAAAPAVDDAFANVQTLLAETGARSRQIDTAIENIDASESSVGIGITTDQGITLEEATTRMMSVQTTLQAALLSTSRLLQTSLTEYLR